MLAAVTLQPTQSMTTFAPPLPEVTRDDDPPVLTDVAPTWTAAKTLAFRAVFIYFGLYIFTTQMVSGFLVFGIPAKATLGLFRPLDVWIGTHLLGLSNIPYQMTGSGDTLHDWVHAFTLVLIAVIGTAIWSIRSRPPVTHQRLFAWLRLYVRIGLGTTMLTYGLIKAIPLQMPTVALTRLVEPFGDFSPMGVLWSSIGASPAYEMATGFAETLAGILILIPATASLGAIFGVFCMTQVFILNMTYDVPVKLFSLHLVLMSAWLLAPDARRLFDVLVMHRPAATAPEPRLFASDKTQSGMIIAQLVFLVITLGVHGFSNATAWVMYGPGAPRSPLFGIWTVDEMTVDGQLLPPLITDHTRWRHVIMQNNNNIAFQKMDNSFVRYGARYDTVARQLIILPPDSGGVETKLSYDRPAIAGMEAGPLTLQGTMDGQAVKMVLWRRDLNSFMLKKRKFSWVQEFPFNR